MPSAQLICITNQAQNLHSWTQKLRLARPSRKIRIFSRKYETSSCIASFLRGREVLGNAFTWGRIYEIAVITLVLLQQLLQSLDIFFWEVFVYLLDFLLISRLWVMHVKWGDGGDLLLNDHGNHSFVDPWTTYYPGSLECWPKISNSHLDHDESVLAEGRALHGERGGSACIGSSEVELVRHHDSAIIDTNRKENGS